LEGREEDGTWKTAPKKRYPKAMCEAMANSIKCYLDRAWSATGIESDTTALPDELSAFFQALDPYVDHETHIAQDFSVFDSGKKKRDPRFDRPVLDPPPRAREEQEEEEQYMYEEELYMPAGLAEAEAAPGEAPGLPSSPPPPPPPPPELPPELKLLIQRKREVARERKWQRYRASLGLGPLPGSLFDRAAPSTEWDSCRV